MTYFTHSPSQAELDLWESTGTDPADDAREARDHAIRRADEHANPSWRDEALLAVHRLARTRATLTSQDVMGLIDAETHEPRAIGATMKEAARRGWIRAGGYIPSKRAESHCRPVRLWHSLIQGAGEL